MRIFVYNCNTYIGKALVKELRRHDENGFNRIFGCQTSAGGAPTTVKRLMTRDDPKKAKKMEEAIRSCSVVVLDLFNCTVKDLYFVLQALKVDPKSNPPRRTGDIEDKDGNKKESLTFILVSSAMVWADTQLDSIVVPAAGEPGDGEAAPPADGEAEPVAPAGPPSAFNEKFFDQRVPVAGSRYEQWREMENLVRTCFSLEGSQVRAFVVGAGVLYGEGEETFMQLFKDAWLGTESHKISAPGTNIIPTVHVRDLARLVRAVCYNPELSPETRPYFLAVDKTDDDTPPTQAEIIKGIVGEVSGSRDIPMIEPPPPPQPREEGEEAAPPPEDSTGPEPSSAEALSEAMLLNLKMEPSSLMLEEGFEWHCRGGLLKNIRMVAEEFSTERQLRAMRVIIAGPPASGKNTLCKAISEHFNIPLLQMDLDDPDKTRTQLCSEVCRYRGYVLNAGLAGYYEVEQLFCQDYELPVDPDAEDAEPPAETAEGEEPAEPAPKKTERRLSEDGIVPAFAVMLQAPVGTCRARFSHAGKGTPDNFKAHMDQFTSRNLLDGQNSFADFFQDIAKIGVFNLPIAMKSEEDMFESTRIYMENGGRPFNYLKSADEVGDELLARQREKEDAAAMMSEVAERQVTVAKDKNEADNKRHLERLRIIGAHESERSQLEALSLREYLMRYMVPNLTEGLIEMCMVMPENPTDYLATYLEEHAATEQSEN